MSLAGFALGLCFVFGFLGASVVEDRSASQDQSSVQEEPPDEEGASSSSEDENQPVIRRSTRERRAPLRYRTGEFDMSKVIQRPLSDWKERVFTKIYFMNIVKMKN
jgi:hypothetical protein